MNPLDMLDKLYDKFGKYAELIMRPGDGYVDYWVRAMRPKDGVYYTSVFRVNRGTGKTMISHQLDHAIAEIQEAIDGTRH